MLRFDDASDVSVVRCTSCSVRREYGCTVLRLCGKTERWKTETLHSACFSEIVDSSLHITLVRSAWPLPVSTRASIRSPSKKGESFKHEQVELVSLGFRSLLAVVYRRSASSRWAESRLRRPAARRGCARRMRQRLTSEVSRSLERGHMTRRSL